MIIKTILSNPSVTTYPTIELLENSPINSLVVQLNSSLIQRKLVLLNLLGFETKMFSMLNGNIYTKNEIDREEFVNEKYCLDNFYCKIDVKTLS